MKLLEPSDRAPQRYNISVPSSPQQPGRKWKILRAETTGVFIIGLLILIITLVRYWRVIPWRAR